MTRIILFAMFWAFMIICVWVIARYIRREQDRRARREHDEWVREQFEDG